MNKNKIVILLAVTALLSSSIGVQIQAANGIAVVTGWDLVDSGKHMDYTVDTKYDGYIKGAADTWNNYLGNQVIRKDSGSTVNDCVIDDVYHDDVTWVGRTVQTPAGELIAGYIHLNTYYMDDLSTTKKILVIKHEFGHSLGCDENDCSDLNIMYPDLLYSNINLTIHDKASVDLAKKSW